MLMTAGIIGPAHGLRGEVIVDVRSDDPGIWAPGTLLRLDGETDSSLTVLGARTHKGRLLLSFDEIDSRDAAEALRGRTILIEERPEEEAWYPHELEGARVETPSGESLGVLVGLRFGAAQDLLVVRTPRGEVLVPFVRALVPEVDAAERRIVVDPPPGLFDDDAVDAGDRGGR